MPVIRWSGICLNRILQHLCSAVYVNDASMQRLKRHLRDGNRPVLYLPSHRSYLDFVLMSYVCFAYDLAIPGIAAGMDFHGMAGVGRLIRRTCAFFMRRSFGTDDGTDLYWRVFGEYMHQLVAAYHTGVEFFVEGTRSRSFKALPPKIGLLAMAVQPLLAGELAEVCVVPIGIAYARPLEEQLFAYELLGVPKPKESTMALFKAAQILGTDHGEMYINFGEPISVRAFFESLSTANSGDTFASLRLQRAQLPLHVQRLTRAELSMCAQLGQHVVVQQQRLIVLSVFNLIAVCVQDHQRTTGGDVSLDALNDGVVRLVHVLRSLGALVALGAHNDNNDNVSSKVPHAVNAALALHSNIVRIIDDDGNAVGGQRTVQLLRPPTPSTTSASDKGGRSAAIDTTATRLKGHQLSPATLRNVLPVLTLQIYSNPCMFWLAEAAIVLLAIRTLSHRVDRQADISDLPPLIGERCLHLRQLFEEEFVLPVAFDVHAILELLRSSGILASRDNEELVLSSLAPFVYCYHRVVDTVAAVFGIEAFTERQLMVQVQQRVELGLFGSDACVHPYSLSMDSIAHALHSLLSNGYLVKSPRYVGAVLLIE